MARFHMDSLVTKTKRKDVRKALEVLPPELDEIYDQTIKRIEEQGKDYSDLAKRVLLWVSSTFRPMSPVELQLAIAVQPGMTKLDDEDLDEQDLLVSVCAGLVVLDAETDTLRFVRKSHHYLCVQNLQREAFPFNVSMCFCCFMTHLNTNVAIRAFSRYKRICDLRDSFVGHWPANSASTHLCVILANQRPDPITPHMSTLTESGRASLVMRTPTSRPAV